MKKAMSFLMTVVSLILTSACSTNSAVGSDIGTDEKSHTGSLSADTAEKTTESENSVHTPSTEYDNVYPQHEPYGMGIGAMPGRVVWAYNPDYVDWDGNGYWWDIRNFDEAVILDMVNDSIASLGGKEDVKDGWTALFTAHNSSQGKSGGYTSGQKIAIKANINGSVVFDDDTSGKTKMSYTNPVLLKALLRSLVEEAGVLPSDITVYDVSRLYGKDARRWRTGKRPVCRTG